MLSGADDQPGGAVYGIGGRCHELSPNRSLVIAGESSDQSFPGTFRSVFEAPIIFLNRHDQQVLDRMFDQPCQRARPKPGRLAALAKLRCGAIALQLSVSAPMGDKAGRFAKDSASCAWARPSSDCKKKGEFIGGTIAEFDMVAIYK